MECAPISHIMPSPSNVALPYKSSSSDFFSHHGKSVLGNRCPFAVSPCVCWWSMRQGGKGRVKRIRLGFPFTLCYNAFPQFLFVCLLFLNLRLKMQRARLDLGDDGDAHRHRTKGYQCGKRGQNIICLLTINVASLGITQHPHPGTFQPTNMHCNKLKASC